jgi:hypothetical protein
MLSERVLELSSNALDKLEALMQNSNDNRLVARIAIDMLDRNPDTCRSTKSLAKVEHAFFNPKVLVVAAQAAAEIDTTECAPTLEAYRDEDRGLGE